MEGSERFGMRGWCDQIMGSKGINYYYVRKGSKLASIYSPRAYVITQVCMIGGATVHLL